MGWKAERPKASRKHETCCKAYLGCKERVLRQTGSRLWICSKATARKDQLFESTGSSPPLPSSVGKVYYPSWMVVLDHEAWFGQRCVNRLSWKQRPELCWRGSLGFWCLCHHHKKVVWIAEQSSKDDRRRQQPWVQPTTQSQTSPVSRSVLVNTLWYPATVEGWFVTQGITPKAGWHTRQEEGS